MTPGPEADRLLLAHMQECLLRIAEYTAGGRSHFEASRLVQDAVMRNLQTLTESSQRLSQGIRDTEANIPWRELAGFRQYRNMWRREAKWPRFHLAGNNLQRKE